MDNHKLKKLIRRREIVINCSSNKTKMRNMSHGFTQRIYANLVLQSRIREQRILQKKKNRLATQPCANAY